MPGVGIGRFMCWYAVVVFIALFLSFFSKNVTKALIALNYFSVALILFLLLFPEWAKEKWTWTFAL